jgi:DNA-binding NtrC family response regulator
MAEILIIDDDPQIRRMLARILTGAGHTVHEASDGRTGMELFRRVGAALVITDLVMPGTEGIETIRELHREEPSVPILAISGSGNNPLYLRAATGLGATAALEKPFGANQLRSIVEDLLKTDCGSST